MTTLENTSEMALKVDQLQAAMDRMEHKQAYQTKVLTHYVTKKNGMPDDLEAGEEGDENKERGNWTGKLDFLLSCLGYAVGLGNVWRFPFLAFDNGGGAFFIPYCIMLGIVGIPIFFMELSLGQFTSCGPTKCWEFALLFQGIGFGMMIVSTMVAIYYNMIIAWAFYYLFASFTDKLPWEDCGSWSSALCGKQDEVKFNFTALTNCEGVDAGYVTDMAKGVCRNSTTQAVVALFNETLAKENGIKRVLASEEYFFNEVLGKTPGKGLEDFGELHWQLALCLLLAWVFVALTLSKGIKTSGKVVYVTATFPYLVLIILLIRGLFLDGYYQGIEFYITPTLDKLNNAKVWKDAAVQIFFSLSASWGGLIALSSYNRFNNDQFRDALIVSFGNCLTSLFAGFVIFSYIGFLAKDMGVDIGDVASGGTSLAFVVYPAAVTKMPISPLWAILFFVMLVLLGVDSEFVLVETVTTSILDLFPRTRKYKTFVVFTMCFTFFLLGLPLCCDGGKDLLDLVDTYAGGWNVLVIAICECVAICYVYGVGRFLKDIECMVGHKVCGFMPWAMWKYWWAFCWCFLTPLSVAFILVFSWIDYTRIDSLPNWADILGWLMTMSVIIAIFGTMIIRLCMVPGSLSERLRVLTNPTDEWGPALPKHRELCRSYVPNFVVDPAAPADGIGMNATPESKYYINQGADMYESK